MQEERRGRRAESTSAEDPMRIGIKVSPLNALKAGIPNYIINLLQQYDELARNTEFFLYTNRPLPEGTVIPERFHLRTVRSPSPSLQMWYHLGLPPALNTDGVDLFHDPVYPIPLTLKIPGVITVHDISNLTSPSFHKLRSAMGALLFPIYLRKASAILTDSAFTAQEIIKRFPACSSRIRVIHLGVSPHFRRITDEVELREVRSRYQLPERFMLFLGTLEPRKNLQGLLDAISDAGEDLPPLVIAGGLGWKYESLLRKIDEHPCSGRIRVTGFIEDRHLPAILSAADFLVYPSLLEGFGLPVLEAMACGTAVLTSGTTSLPEVAGEAALYVDPGSTESILSGLRRLSIDSELREELARRGLVRARMFTWRETALKTLEAYRSVLSEGSV